MLYCKYNKKVFLNTEDLKCNILSIFKIKSGISALFSCWDFKTRIFQFDSDYNLIQKNEICDKILKLKPFTKDDTYMQISSSNYGKIDILNENFESIDNIYPKISFNNGYLNSAFCFGSEILLCYSNAIFYCNNKQKPKLLISSKNGGLFIDSIMCEDYLWVIEYFDGKYFLNVYKNDSQIYSQPLQANLCVTSLYVTFDEENSEFTTHISAYSNLKNYIFISKYGFLT